MNILVTGAKGMVGTALCNNLKNIRDGKNKTRPALNIEEIYEYDAYGNKSSVTNALGEETRYSYDKYQRLVEVVEADGAKNT